MTQNQKPKTWTPQLVCGRVSDALRVLNSSEQKVGHRGVKSSWVSEAGGFVNIYDYADYLGKDFSELAALNLIETFYSNHMDTFRSRDVGSALALDKMNEAIGWQITYLRNAPIRLRDAFSLWGIGKINRGSINKTLSVRENEAKRQAKLRLPEHKAAYEAILDAAWEECTTPYKEQLESATGQSKKDIIAIVTSDYAKELMRLKATDGNLYPHMTTELCITRDALDYSKNKAAAIIASGLIKDKVMVR